MKKSVYPSLSAGLLWSVVLCSPVHADIPIPSNNTGSNLNQYILNLGKYLGYDLTTYCPNPGGCQQGTTAPYNEFLISATSTSGSELNLLTNFLGAIVPSLAMVMSQSGQSSVSTNQNQFLIVPSNSSYSTLMKQYGAQTFVKPVPYSSGGDRKSVV